MKSIKTLMLTTLICITVTAFAQQPDLQFYRNWDQTGINTFEPKKHVDQPEYEGFKIRIGGAFTQDFQYLTHENKADFNPFPNGNNRNYLFGVITNPADPKFDTLGATLSGFNLAMANLNLDFQIADGIRVALENYMSARHHPEFWVKGGYIQIDRLPMFNNPAWFDKYFRVKLGHFQPNFGDMQFRRTDGGNAMYNPFVENFILDAFTTEIGGELYAFPTSDLMIMVGMSSGFINGNINNFPGADKNGVVPEKKNPSIFAKVAYDKQFNEDFRFRLSASVYNNSNHSRNTLYAGDRTGSHYFMVMEQATQYNPSATPQYSASSTANQFTSGRFNPDMPNRITAFMINPFIKFSGLEVFGSYEILSGSNYADTKTDANNNTTWERRAASQYVAEIVYRFLANEQVFVGGRYIGASVEPRGMLDANGDQITANISRMAFSAGWFPTKNLLVKAEYVLQNYTDFPTTDYRSEGKFNGFMVQAVVGF